MAREKRACASLAEPLARWARHVATQVNQVERHPLNPEWALLDFCAANGIVMQAHTPLGGQDGHAVLFQHSLIRRIAGDARRTPAQVLVEWNLRHGVAVVSKCSSDEHADQLLEVASSGPRLSPEQMKWLDAITPPGQPVQRWCRGPAGMRDRNAMYAWV